MEVQEAGDRKFVFVEPSNNFLGEPDDLMRRGQPLPKPCLSIKLSESITGSILLSIILSRIYLGLGNKLIGP